MTGLAEKVNTFIGTDKEGNVFPGASAPFGMIQVSPIGDHFSGWKYGDEIRGLGHSFVSGAGCWEQGGQLSVLPTVGEVGPGKFFNTEQASTFDHHNYKSPYDKDRLVGKAGYFSVTLTKDSNNPLTVEATAGTRASAERYTFPPSKNANVFINVGQANGRGQERNTVKTCKVEIVENNVVKGQIETSSFCGHGNGGRYTTYFYMKFDQDFTSYGTWTDSGGNPGSTSAAGTTDNALCGAWVTFDLSNLGPDVEPVVTVVTAISWVDARGAETNFTTEGCTSNAKDIVVKSFDQLRAEATNVWNEELDCVVVEGLTDDVQVVFYTALYHALLQPMTASDADGRYRYVRGPDHEQDGIDTTGQMDLLRVLFPVGYHPCPESAHRGPTALTSQGHCAIYPRHPREGRLAAPLVVRQLRVQRHDRRPRHPLPGGLVAVRRAGRCRGQIV